MLTPVPPPTYPPPALVSMIAINMTFFDRHGLFDKVPSLSTSMAIVIIVVFSIAIVGLLGMVAYMLLRPAGAAEAERKARLGVGGAWLLCLLACNVCLFD
jgi:hypothetical protein